jgi:ferritin-like metal-binding protein YciE
MDQKIIQYLDEAHATEAGLIRVLQSQIAMTPRGTYRTALERHLRETSDHARRIEIRLRELDRGPNPIQAGIGVAETVLAQALAVGKLPLDLLRGSGRAEKVLKNAKDAAASEALEIATYTAIERLAGAAGDDETAELARSIRADEQRMLERVLDAIPELTDAVIGDSYHVTETGAPDVTRGSEPWAGYDEQTVDEIRAALGKADRARARAVRDYERAHKQRASVIEATERELARA